MRILRSMRQGHPPELLSNAPIANNFRPLQTANYRTVRTNINPSQHSKVESLHFVQFYCTDAMWILHVNSKSKLLFMFTSILSNIR